MDYTKQVKLIGIRNNQFFPIQYLNTKGNITIDLYRKTFDFIFNIKLDRIEKMRLYGRYKYLNKKNNTISLIMSNEEEIIFKIS